MIQYDPGKWSVVFACSLNGSVFPKAFVWAFPCSVLSVALHTFLANNENFQEIGAGDVGASVLSGFTFILGFLVVFRSQQAYSRWWEGGTLLQQLRGEWFNAYSSLMAFCNMAPEKQDDVLAFQHRLARLCSLLYCTAIQQVSTMEVKNYEIIDIQDFDAESMKYLIGSHDRCEVCLQWIQRLIGDAADSLTIKVAPPILSRVFNQLGNGIVNLNNARKITEFPIPFPLAQMITFMLLIHWLITAFVCAASVERSFWAGILSFIVTFSFWSINYIAVELEQPFGDDANDLPLHDMQEDMNKSLVALLDHRAQHPPEFAFREDHRRLDRSTQDIEQIFGEKQPIQRSVSRAASLVNLIVGGNQNGSTASHTSTTQSDVDAKPAPMPPVAIGQRQSEPAGLMVFTCAEDQTGTGSWPQVDKEAAAAPPAVVASSIAHAAKPPLMRSSWQNRGDMPSETPSTHRCNKYASKDQPVSALRHEHPKRVLANTESVSSVPCPAALGHPDDRRSAGTDHGLQRRWDTLQRETIASQAQEAGWAGLAWPPSERMLGPNLGVAED